MEASAKGYIEKPFLRCHTLALLGSDSLALLGVSPGSAGLRRREVDCPRFFHSPIRGGLCFGQATVQATFSRTRPCRLSVDRVQTALHRARTRNSKEFEMFPFSSWTVTRIDFAFL